MDAILPIIQPLYTLLSYLADLLLSSVLPDKMATGIRYGKDLFASMLCIVGGRLLPTLHPMPDSLDLTGKTAVVTGSNSGIGLQIASDLAGRNCTVYLACRSPSRARTAVDTITTRHPTSVGKVFVLPLDTSSLESVRAFARAWPSSSPSASSSSSSSSSSDGDDTPVRSRIDILVHNAGIAAPSDPARNFTDDDDDGLEVIYATNLLGSFALTYRLETHLAPDARVVFTSSTGQYSGQFAEGFAAESVPGVVESGFHRPPSGSKAGGVAAGLDEKVLQDGSSGRYGNTKAMQVALAKLLQRRWDRDTNVTVDGRGKASGTDGKRRVAHAFTPGFTYTPIFAKLKVENWWKDWLFVVLKATLVLAVGVDQGAATGTWLATTSDEKVVGPGNGGGYWDRMVRRMSSADLLSDQMLNKLWSRWEKDAGIKWR